MSGGPHGDKPVVERGLARDDQTVSATQETSPYHSLAAPQRVTTPNAVDILKVCTERSLIEKTKLLLEARTHLTECKGQDPVEGSSFQVGRLVMLPTQGTSYFMSDLEGRADLLAKLIDQERLLERWRKNDPNDQVFLCILGDIVNRNEASSLLVDLLLELKCRYGFSRNIVILGGNHELTPDVQKEHADGLYHEVTKGRRLAVPAGDVHDPIVQELIEVKLSHAKESPDGHLNVPANTAGRLEFAREGAWNLYNEVFSLLPLSIVTPRGGYIAHAGFPVRGGWEDLYVESPRSEEENDEYLLALGRYEDGVSTEGSRLMTTDMTWNNFNPALDSPSSTAMFTRNWERGRDGKPGPGLAFGLKGFELFASIKSFTLFLRGHQRKVADHPSVERPTYNTWRCGPILTIANGMEGGYGVLDLSIDNPTPASVSLGVVQEEFELEF